VIPEARIRAFAAESWSQPPTFDLPVPDVSDRAILDLCGGPGVYTKIFAERGARRVCWFDASSTLEEIAREKLGALPVIEYRVGDMSDLSGYAGASFDGVFFRDALHHARDEARVLREVARILRPGGWLYLRFPNIRRVLYERNRVKASLHVPVVALGLAFGTKPRATIFCSRRSVRAGARAAGLVMETSAVRAHFETWLLRKPA
jgi:ubiquinone/menaquinone biosynthesis C-methylase UbiE